MCVGRNGYVGLVRQAENRVHVGAAVDPAACHAGGGPKRVMQEILEGCGVELPGLEKAVLEGTPPLTGRRVRVAGNRVLAVGDSCGYVEPFTGEGMSWAIRGAMACVGMLPERAGWSPAIAAGWQVPYRDEVGQRQRWCGWLRSAMRRPMLAGVCLNVARWIPWVPTMMARRISA